MKVVGIIPARYGSKRLPGKPLITINNKPLIELTYHAVAQSKLFDLILIATDSERISSLSKSFGAECIITSNTSQNGTERCADLINRLDKQIHNQDLIVNIQCDEPFIKKEHLKKIIKLFNKSTKIGTLISPIHHNELNDSSVVKLITDHNRNAIDFSRNTDNFSKKNKLYKHIGVYAYLKSTLIEISTLKETKREKEEKLEQLRWLQNNYPISCAFIKENLQSINTLDDIKNL
tara:strand:+ start:776 stop:1477 length:702 start_codon:yes stop_codon:yes gene_type:complete